MKLVTSITTILTCVGFALVATGCGSLNPKTEGQIKTALEGKNEEFQKCYEKALKDNRNLEGEIALNVKFDPKDTRPSEVKIGETDIKNAKMKKCVSKAADKIRIQDAPGVFVEGLYTVKFQFK